MFSYDHIVSYTLSGVVHLLGLLLIGLQVSHRADDAPPTPPELVVTTVELSLSKESPGEPGAGQAVAQADFSDIPALQVPDPVETPPPSQETPEKPDFTDALPPPPEPAPVPEPVSADKPKPAPIPVAKPAAPSARTAPTEPSAAKGSAAVTKGSSTTHTAMIEPGDGGGGEGGSSGKVDGQPALDRPIKPTYPIGARRRGEEGTVILDVAVAADGSATSVSLVSSSGFRDLDRAAQRAVEQARFKPGTRNGRATPSAARLTLIFRLRGP